MCVDVHCKHACMYIYIHFVDLFITFTIKKSFSLSCHTMASALRGVYHRKSVISPWTNPFHIHVCTYVLSMVKSCTSSAAEGSGLVIETRGRGAG